MRLFLTSTLSRALPGGLSFRARKGNGYDTPTNKKSPATSYFPASSRRSIIGVNRPEAFPPDSGIYRAYAVLHKADLARLRVRYRAGLTSVSAYGPEKQKNQASSCFPTP
jgi:hypothetical protein